MIDNMSDSEEEEGVDEPSDNKVNWDELEISKDLNDIPINDNDSITPSDPKIDPLDCIVSAYTMFNAEELVSSAESGAVEIDLYDSGATRHMSGFHHRFVDLTQIEPIPIQTADK